MSRSLLFAFAVALAGCATQGSADDWHLSEKKAIAIGNGALAAKGFEPSKYRWHQRVWRYTDTRDWFIEFSARYPGPGGEDVLVVLNDDSRKRQYGRPVCAGAAGPERYYQSSAACKAPFGDDVQ